MEGYWSMDGLRAVGVLLFALGQPLMAYFPQLAKWPETTPSRSAKLRNPVVPIEWAFAIWGVLFGGCIVFAVWQVLPANLDDPLARAIGWLALSVFAANVAWEYHVPKRGLDEFSVTIILIEFALLVAILVEVDRLDWRDHRFWLIAVPFQLLAGWVSAATFVNAVSALQNRGNPISHRLSATMIVGAAVLGAGLAFAVGGIVYALGISWALFGIAIANLTREQNTSLATLSSLLIPFVVGAAAIGTVG